MSIRAEHPADISAIRLVNLAAFDTPTEANAVDRLRASGCEFLSLVFEREAEQGGELVGHILFTPVTIAGVGGAVAGLAPVAVSPLWQRQGIGSRLIEQGLEACRQAGYEAVVVLGHVSYYPRFGFLPASRFGIGCEFDVPDGAFMAMELEPGALDDAMGVARYHEVFSSL